MSSDRSHPKLDWIILYNRCITHGENFKNCDRAKIWMGRYFDSCTEIFKEFICCLCDGKRGNTKEGKKASSIDLLELCPYSYCSPQLCFLSSIETRTLMMSSLDNESKEYLRESCETFDKQL